VVGSLVDVLLARFHRYLLEERGLAVSTAGAPTRLAFFSDRLMGAAQRELAHHRCLP